MSAPEKSPAAVAPATTAAPPAEVRYSLPTLLREIQIERTAAAFAGEKLDQVEISKIYQKKKITLRRAVKKSQ